MPKTIYENRNGCYKPSNVPYDILNRKINDYFEFNNGLIVHRTPVKCIINPILRCLQFWTHKPYVITTVSDHCPVNGYYFIKYTFNRVEKLK